MQGYFCGNGTHVLRFLVKKGLIRVAHSYLSQYVSTPPPGKMPLGDFANTHGGELLYL